MERSVNPEREALLRQLAAELRIWRQEATRAVDDVDDLTLAAYVAGELDDARRQEVEVRLAAAPDLAEAVRAVSETLQAGDWRGEAAADGLKLRLPLLLAPAVPATEATAAPAARPRPFWRIPRWAAAVALAVAFLLGILVGAAAFGPWMRDAFRVSTETLGGNSDATLDSGITDAAQGQVRKSLADLKDSK